MSKNFRLNYIFFIGSIKLFHDDLKSFATNISSIPAEELLIIMASLVAIKEDIESIEKVYLKLYS